MSHFWKSFLLYCQALGDLLSKYRDHFQYFWKIRQDFTMPKLTGDEAEFLPATLSLQGKPISPTGRYTAKILIIFIVTLLIWAYFGHMDIVITASGKVIPSHYSKSIASVETARINAIYVHNGQHVQSGDVLIELDAKISESDKKKAQGNLQTASLAILRSRAMQEAIATHHRPKLSPKPSDVELSRWIDCQNQLDSQWQEFKKKYDRFDADVIRYKTELHLAGLKAQNYKDLMVTHDVSMNDWLEKEQSRVEIERLLTEAQSQLNQVIAEAQKINADALNDSLKASEDSRQDKNKAEAQTDFLILKSPIEGTIQQLTSHTLGGVVPAAQNLMVIVPDDDLVEIEAFIENKDIGFVREGQIASVKIESFDYTKYGTLPAHVRDVSRDSIDMSGLDAGLSPQDKDKNKSNSDGKKTLLYQTLISLDRSWMMIDGKKLAISPGMVATVDIKTGSRKVIDYFLAPLLQHGQESFHER